MEWPQILMIILLTTRTVGAVYLHGQTHKVNCGNAFIGTCIYAVILYAGGFWG